MTHSRLRMRHAHRGLALATFVSWVSLLALSGRADDPQAQASDEAGARAATGTLHVDVEPVPTSGELHLELHAGERTGWDEAPLRSERRPVQPARATLALAGLPEGSYAIRVFLDQNANGRLDLGRRGVPLEPFGFSLAAGRKALGVPRIEAATFRFSPPEQRIAIRLRTRRGNPTSSPPAPALPREASPSADGAQAP